MATLEENIQKVANLKSSLQTQFENKGIDYTGVSFENYGNIVRDDMEKALIEQSKDVTPTTSAQTITPDDGYKLTQVNVEAIQVEQKEVKSSLVSQTIVPSTGKFISQITVQPLNLETKIVSPTTSQQEITSSADKDGIEKVIVEAVTSSIDENIIPDNIKQGISILGVTGNMMGGITDLDCIKYHDNMIQIETGRVPPTDEEYQQIIEKGYKILDYVFRGATA